MRLTYTKGSSSTKAATPMDTRPTKAIKALLTSGLAPLLPDSWDADCGLLELAAVSKETSNISLSISKQMLQKMR